MPETVETIVIGGGQAGLAMSHHLRLRGREHLVLERGRVAERWRSERWDSLHFQFPNRMMRLPGHAYAGDAPDGFMPRDGVAGFIAAYAARIAAPLRCGVAVEAVRRTEAGRFRVQAGPMLLEARNVVLATGPYQVPRLPEAAARIPPGIHQVTANRYRNPANLPPGGVLVVGSGGSGCQIAEDLLAAGRDVHLALRGHRRVPRRYRGHDFGAWEEAMGLTDRTVEQIPPGFRPPLLTGVGGGRTVDLRDMARRGVRLLGSLRGVQDGRACFAADLNANLAAGDAAFRGTLRAIDSFVETQGVACGPPGEYEAAVAAEPAPLPEQESLDLCRAGIGTIVWALGYRTDFRWVEGLAPDERGVPPHRRGVTPQPGLYLLGLSRLHKVNSAFLWGVGEDAAHLADQILTRC